MNDLVEEFFSSPIPEKVWHYTTIAALEGILSSGTIWATEARYTTDPSEFVHARTVGAAFLEKIEPTEEHKARAKQIGLQTLAHAFDVGALSPASTEVFIASFSSSADLKSQWMGYADGGQGVSIAFDLRGIRPPRESGCAVTFARCIYTQEEKENLLAVAVGHFVETYSDLLRTHNGITGWFAEQIAKEPIKFQSLLVDFEADLGRIVAQMDNARTHTSFDLLRLASHCKDYSYHEEAEWRLSLPHTKGKPFMGIHVKYRGSQQNIPYLAHNLFCEKLPITQVLAGPFCQYIEQIQELLHAYGYSVPVTKSKIPIRKANEIQ